MTVRSTVIIGAGIAGLYTGIELLWAGCRDVVIYEKYNYVGGRVVTSAKGYEIGAGRIHTSHSLVRSLIKKYGLKWLHLSDVPSAWIERPGAAAVENTFEEEMPAMLGPLEMLGSKALAENTVGELLCRVHGEARARDFIDRFPYYTEMWSMRADVALMSFMSREGFGTIRGGIGSLIRAMREEFERLGGRICLGWTAVAARPPGGTVILRDPDNKLHRVDADVIVFALHASALKRIDGFCADLKRDLGRLEMAPLVRIYAEGKWPAEILKRKIVTRSPLRYIIPVAPSRGLVMVSYTDGDDTMIWAKGEKARRGWERRILSELRRLMGVEISEPTFMKAYPWADGTTYWLPGNYDVSAVAARIMVPRCGSGRMYICGESISVGKQAWMEGALETAADVVKMILSRGAGAGAGAH